MKLELLKKVLQEKLGISNYDLTNDELIKIFQEIRSIPKGDRSVPKLQLIVKSITHIDIFTLNESFDNSDLDNIIDLIEDALRDRK